MFLPLTIVIMTHCLRSSFGEVDQNAQIANENNTTSYARTNVISAEPLPWQIVEPNEPGFELSDKEMETFRIWPAGVIPYFVDGYSFDKTMRSRLVSLLEAVNSVSGLRFTELMRLPESQDERWVLFVNRRGVLACEDYTPDNFTYKGVQRVVLGYDCVLAGGGALAPTVLALAGVPPQHNAPDRDKYITVNMENILPDKKHLFQKLNNNQWLFHDLTYDYLSAGHYNFHKYTANGKATIIPKYNIGAPVGESDGISYNDIWKIKMLYNYIATRSSKVKDPGCSLIYKLKNMDETQKLKLSTKKQVKPRNKPAKYLSEITSEGSSSVEIEPKMETFRHPSVSVQLKAKGARPMQHWSKKSDFNTSDG